MEDARCLLDVISDPQALTAFLEQEQNANKQQQNAQLQNVSHAAAAQPGTSLTGHQYLLQHPQTPGNQVKIVGSPMPPPSHSPMAPSPMNHPVGSPLVAHGSPMPMVAHGSPITMVARSPQQPPSPQVHQTVLQQVPSPSPIGGTRTNSPMMIRQPQLLPKPTINSLQHQQQASIGQSTIQIQKAIPQSASPSSSLSLPVPIQPGITNKVQNASNTLHYQPQPTTSMISTIQNSTPINLQGSTILQTSTGKFLLPSGIRLQNLQQFISPQGGAGQQVVLQNQIVQNTQQSGLGLNPGNANLVNYSQQPSQIVIQGANGPQQGNIILRTLPSVLQTATQNTGQAVQNGQKTILIAPHQNMGQFQTTTGAVSLNHPTNVNLLPKTLPIQNGNVIVNVGGQNINLQQLKNLQALNVQSSNVNQVANASKIQGANINVQLSQANVIRSSIPQMTTVHSQLVNDSANQPTNVGSQIFVNQMNQTATKTNASLSNTITSTSQLVSSVIAAQSKLIANANAKSLSNSKKQIQIQRAGDANRRSPGNRNANGGQVATNQVMTNSLSAAQAQANNILSQAISICNLEFDASKTANLTSNSTGTFKTNSVPSNHFGSVPTPVSRQPVLSTAVNASNVTFSRVIPSVSNTAVTFSQNLNSSPATAGNLPTPAVNTSYPKPAVFASSVASMLSSGSSHNLQSAPSSSFSLSNPTMCTTATNSSHSTIQKPVVSQFLDVKTDLSRFLNVKPVVSELAKSQFMDVKPVMSQSLDVKALVSQLNVQPSPVQGAPILQCAQPSVSMSTAITTVAASNVTQCPTISSSTVVPISSTLPPPPLENNTPKQVQTVHLSQQAQIALQKVQAQMKLLLAKTERRPEEDVHLQKLYEVQRKIVAHGHQIALKKQEILQQSANQSVTLSLSTPQTLSASHTPVTDAKTAIARIQNMHNVPAPNVTILKTGATATIAETKANVIPAPVQGIAQGGIQGAKLAGNDPKSLAVPTQVKVGNHVIAVNLSPEQKARLELQLAKLTVEQQEVFYKVNMSQRLQQKQQLLKQQQQQQQLEGLGTAQVKQEPMDVKPIITAPGMVAVTIQEVAPGINQVKPILTTSPVTNTFTSSRGIKRISTGAISRTSLLSQQLQKDQAAVLAPNCTNPFIKPVEACRRLLRYHVFHEKEPPSYIRQKEEENFEEYAGEIFKKGRKMLDWYRMLLLEESMRAQPTSELVMMERMFLLEEREQLATDRRKSKEDPANFIPMPITTHQEPKVVDVPPTAASSASTTPVTPSSGGWMSTPSHNQIKVQLTSKLTNSQNSIIPQLDSNSESEESIPCLDKPKLGVKLIIKRNYKDISGANSYVSASHNPGSDSPSLPKDYEDFRTSLTNQSVISEQGDLEVESMTLGGISQSTSNEQGNSDLENSNESGGYVCAAGYAEDLDDNVMEEDEEAMNVGISGDDTMTDGDLSQSEDVMAVDSLLHSDLDVDERHESDDDDPIEIPDFFHNAPDTALGNDRASLCNELSVLNSLDSTNSLVSPYGDDSRSSYSVDMPDIQCQPNTAIEGLLTHVPSNPMTDPLGLNDPIGITPTNLKDPLGLNDSNSDSVLIDEGASGSDMETEQLKHTEDFESALSSVASSIGADLSKPEAPVSVDSGLQSGGLDNSVEPLEPLESLDYLSDISDVEEEDLGEQMQNAIDSILSLQGLQGLSFPWSSTFASSSMTQGMVRDSFVGLTQLDDEDSTENEDDIDAAVQSIL